MKFFESIFPKKSKELIAVTNLHKDFNLSDQNFWMFNRQYDLVDNVIKAKIRFSFDDPAFLDNCKFVAKIGISTDSNIPTKFIGFAYGEDEEKLKEFANRFPFAELITNLDRNGVSSIGSKVIPIKS